VVVEMLVLDVVTVVTVVEPVEVDEEDMPGVRCVGICERKTYL
jgi:hypothetical protein